MEEVQEPVEEAEVTSNDRLWAALSWIPITPLWPLLAIIALLMENTRERPFIHYNAAVSIVTGVILIPLSIVTLGLASLLYLVFFTGLTVLTRGRRWKCHGPLIGLASAIWSNRVGGLMRSVYRREVRYVIINWLYTPYLIPEVLI